MPGLNVACIGVSENQNTGAVTFKFSNGNNLEMSSWSDVGLVADEVDADPTIAQKILMCKAYRNSPDGANKTNQVGGAVSVNGLASIPVDYTEPQ